VGIISYLAAGFSRRIMRKIISERNVAAFLFVLVIVIFSFAHEDSKKRSSNYSVSTRLVSPDKTLPALISISPKQVNPVSVK
jgi:hypothetical protein